MSDLIRAHFGAGPYLDGWANVQIWADHVHAPADRPDLVAAWRAADEGPGYYAGAGAAELVGDVRQDWTVRAAFAHGAVGEVLCRDLFDGFSPTQAAGAMDAFDFVLAPGGRLRIGVRHVRGCLPTLLAEADLDKRRALAADLLARHGPDLWAAVPHSPESLAALAARFGFVMEATDLVAPDRAGLPRIEMAFRKPTVTALDPVPWQRLIDPAAIPADWRCLEVGPGPGTAWPRANVVLDVVDRPAAELPPGATFLRGDVCGPIPLPDKSIDFVLATHVLEHVRDPAAACRELSRVARRGIVECPSPFKEALLGFEGAGFDHTDYAGHEWWVWPAGPGRLRFTRPDPYFTGPLASRDVSRIMHQMLRLGPAFGEPGHVLRRWYTEHLGAWNTILAWEGEIVAEVIA